MSTQPPYDRYGTKVDPEEGIFVSYTAMSNFTTMMEALNPKQSLDYTYFPHKFMLSAEGGLAMCWVFPKFYANVEFFNSGEIVALIDNKVDPVDIFEIDATSKAAMTDGLQRVTKALIGAL